MIDRDQVLHVARLARLELGEEELERMSTELPTIPRVFLTEKDEDVTDARLRELSAFASGIGPEKHVIERHPDISSA